jgi:hypothetical protein
MKTIFVKPADTRTWIAVFDFDEAGATLSRVLSVPTKEEDITAALVQCGEVERINFDGTVYAHVGISVRSKTELPVFIYRPKGNVFDRIKGQSEWVQENITILQALESINADYAAFVRLSEDLKEGGNMDTSPADLFSDAARYFRRVLI